MASFGADDRHRCCDGLYDVLNDAILELRDSGRLDPESYRRLIFPIYFRSREELVAPVVRADSPAAAWFHVDRVESMEVPVPFTHAGEIPAMSRFMPRNSRVSFGPLPSRSFDCRWSIKPTLMR